MELTGTWKPYGKYAEKDQSITIQGQELTFGIRVADQPPTSTTVHFRLEEEHSLRENHCHNLIIEETEFKIMDFMVHEETIEGRQVVILSKMTMEYDGRGRIVIASYVREEDYRLINDDFKSAAYQYWNDRPAVPMMQMGPGGNVPMGMMSDMMAGRMSASLLGMMSGMQAAAPGPVTQVEPWDCTCGNKQITTKFCGECGQPCPKQ